MANNKAELLRFPSVGHDETDGVKGQPVWSMRDALIKSGKPLEEETGHIFRGLGIVDRGSYHFQRQGWSKSEETDRHGIWKTEFSNGQPLTVHFFVECKATKGTWILFDAPQSIVNQSQNMLFPDNNYTSRLAQAWVGTGPISNSGRMLYQHREWDVNAAAVQTASGRRPLPPRTSSQAKSPVQLRSATLTKASISSSLSSSRPRR